MRKLNVGIFGDSFGNDKRNCHMTPKNNQIFYECVDNWIQTKQFNLKKCNFDFTKEYIQQYVGNLDE